MTNIRPLAVGAWLSRNKLLTALILVVVLGYAIGKDAALRDNARDALQSPNVNG